jgi:hypothetical protein
MCNSIPIHMLALLNCHVWGQLVLNNICIFKIFCVVLQSTVWNWKGWVCGPDKGTFYTYANIIYTYTHTHTHTHTYVHICTHTGSHCTHYVHGLTMGLLGASWIDSKLSYLHAINVLTEPWWSFLMRSIPLCVMNHIDIECSL